MESTTEYCFCSVSANELHVDVFHFSLPLISFEVFKGIFFLHSPTRWKISGKLNSWRESRLSGEL